MCIGLYQLLVSTSIFVLFQAEATEIETNAYVSATNLFIKEYLFSCVVLATL